MITGLRLKITSEELKEHCLARAGHHDGRAKIKREELPKLRDAMEQIKQSGSMVTGISNMGGKGNSYHLDPSEAVEGLERDIQQHDNSALVFRYFAAHLYDEDYDLAETDLRRLEILK